jgi:hypothetical protein
MSTILDYCCFEGRAQANKYTALNLRSSPLIENMSVEKELVFRKDISLLSSRMKNNVGMQNLLEGLCSVDAIQMCPDFT